MLYLNADSTLTDCNDVEDVIIQENELVQDYKKLSRKKQVNRICLTSQIHRTVML